MLSYVAFGLFLMFLATEIKPVERIPFEIFTAPVEEWLVSPLEFEEESASPLELLEQCEKKFATVEDYTAIVVKYQRVEGRPSQPETIFMKFKKPFSIYLKWVKDPDAGREVIYVDGKNNNKITVQPGGFLKTITPTLYLDPTHPSVLKGNLKPITQAGMGQAIQTVLRLCRKAAKAGDLILLSKGKINFEGRNVYVVERRLPEGKGYPNAHAILYIDEKFLLPVYFASYDKNNQLLEKYITRSLKLNVGLTDKDFDPANPEYDF